MHSGVIPDNGFSVTYLTIWSQGDARYDATTDGNRISFDLKVSSQKIGDKLTFKIGGEVMQVWSGDVVWQRVTHDIPSRRPMNMEWEYRKDTVVKAGSDSAWIRRVIVE